MPSTVVAADEEWPNPTHYLAIAKSLYGRNNVQYMTDDLAKQLAASKVKVWALVGRTWMTPRTQKAKLKNMTEIRPRGFRVLGQPLTMWPSGPNDDIVFEIPRDKKTTVAYPTTDYLGRRMFVTVQGLPLIVFVVGDTSRAYSGATVASGRSALSSPARSAPRSAPRSPPRSPLGSPVRSPPKVAAKKKRVALTLLGPTFDKTKATFR